MRDLRPPDSQAEERLRLRALEESLTPTGPLCSCGHGRTAHEHYRRGRDCALCGCHTYRRRWLMHRGRA